MNQLRFVTLMLVALTLFHCTTRDNQENETDATDEGYPENDNELLSEESEEADNSASFVMAFQRGEFVYVRPESGEAIRLVKGTNPSISPDGKKLAYTKSGGSDNNFTREIYMIDLQTRAETKLNVRGHNYYGAIWSPDGKHLAFNYFTGTNWEVGIINSDNTGFRTTQGNDELGVFSPTWHPDGQSIVAHNMSDIVEYDLSGESIRGVNIDKIISEEYSISSSTRFWITADREFLFFNAEVDEYRDDLEGPLEVIAYYNLDTNEGGRISPKDLYATDLYVTPERVLVFDGFKENQETSDVYRYDFKSQKLEIVVKNGIEPTIR